MAVPSLPTFSSGPAASADLNMLVTAIAWLMEDRPGTRVTSASPFSVSSSSSWTTVPLASVIRDRAGSGSDGTGITIEEDGDYWIGAAGQMSNVACNKDMRILIDGTDEGGFDSAIGLLTPTPGRFAIIQWMPLTAGTTLELQAWRDGATAVDVEVISPRSPILFAVWDSVGP